MGEVDDVDGGKRGTERTDRGFFVIPSLLASKYASTKTRQDHKNRNLRIIECVRTFLKFWRLRPKVRCAGGVPSSSNLNVSTFV